MTALLLWRDQRWFAEILGNLDATKFNGNDGPARLQLKDMLARRVAVLNAIMPQQIAATPAGTWGNALATVSVGRDGIDALRVTLTAMLSYGERDDTLTCDLTGTFKPDNGWFAGDLSAQDGTTTPARLRLQGNTLRVVHLYGDRDQSVCGELAMMTGTYFPMHAAAIGTAAAVAARTVAPSFKCATAQNADEEEICADPDLAAQDAALARVYGETLRRLELRPASSLRADQRNWVKDNPTAFNSSLHPAANKPNYMLHQTDSARGIGASPSGALRHADQSRREA